MEMTPNNNHISLEGDLFSAESSVQTSTLAMISTRIPHAERMWAMDTLSCPAMRFYAMQQQIIKKPVSELNPVIHWYPWFDPKTENKGSIEKKREKKKYNQ